MCAPITAGAYLRLRREAAGLSTGDVAALISTTAAFAALNRTLIGLIEAGQHEPTPGMIDRLATAFRFDRHLVDLILGFDRVMRVCRGCGCSDLDRCDDEAAGECAWSAEHPGTCTHCVRRAAIAAPALPFHPA